MWQLLSTVKSSRTIVIARARSCGRRKSKFDVIRGKKSSHALAWGTGHSQHCAADGGLGLCRATESRKQDEASDFREVLCDY